MMKTIPEISTILNSRNINTVGLEILEKNDEICTSQLYGICVVKESYGSFLEPILIGSLPLSSSEHMRPHDFLG